MTGSEEMVALVDHLATRVLPSANPDAGYIMVM